MPTNEPDANDPKQPDELPVIYATLNVKLPPDAMNKLVNTDTDTSVLGETHDRQL